MLAVQVNDGENVELAVEERVLDFVCVPERVFDPEDVGVRLLDCDWVGVTVLVTVCACVLDVLCDCERVPVADNVTCCVLVPETLGVNDVLVVTVEELVPEALAVVVRVGVDDADGVLFCEGETDVVIE